MKALLSVAILGSVLLLSACNGDSDSSGEKELTDRPSDVATLPKSAVVAPVGSNYHNEHANHDKGNHATTPDIGEGMLCDTGGDGQKKVYVVDSCYYTPKGAEQPQKYTCHADGTISTNVDGKTNTFPHNSTFQGITYYCAPEH